MIVGTIKNQSRPAEILLVEDNYADVVLAKKAFTTAKLSNNISVAMDGEQALALLRRKGQYATASIPDIIFLDLKLPKRSGNDVLEAIKSDPAFKHIPVVILTSSMAEIDVVKSYSLHANGYIVKPVSLEKFAEIVKSIEQFWFTLAILPDHGAEKKDAP